MVTKTVVTVVSIRPDLIRMSEVIKRLDKTDIHHVVVHTGQHYDPNLNSMFFKELGIRDPDFVLEAGKNHLTHYDQLSYLCKELPRLLQQIKPHLVVLLGDSNSVAVVVALKKEQYRIAHIEAGMRSFDKRMLEEINRTVCDHCSDLLFVYHEDYANHLRKEGIHDNIHVVGNTILEPIQYFLPRIQNQPKRSDHILVDIHRPENVKYPERLQCILAFANECARRYDVSVYILKYKPTFQSMQSLDMGVVQWVDLLPFQDYLDNVYHSLFILSDSGTAQEEACLLRTKALIPRDYTERPQSFAHQCSFPLLFGVSGNRDACIAFLEDPLWEPDIRWLGDGTTSQSIVEGIKHFLFPQVV